MARTVTLRGTALPLLVALGAISCSSKDDTTDEGGVQKVVYAVRQHTVVNGSSVSIDVAGGMGQVMDYLRYNPGGRLELYDIGAGEAQNIIEDFKTADVSSLDVSFDAKKVVFSMKTAGNDSYHIYWAGLDRVDGKFEVHQLTFGPWDDIYPIWVAGGRIAFVTNEAYTEMGTRADEYNHSRIVTQIATITAEGGDADRKLCSQNLSHTINLYGRADGRIGFSRWEHLENINDVKMFAMNPDCTQMIAVAGQHDKPGNSLVQVSETNTPNVYLAVTTSRENTIQAGTLVRIDARHNGDSHVVDEEMASFDVLTPAVPAGMEPSPVGRYRTPTSLPDGRILTSWADGNVNEINELSATPPDFGVYIYDVASRVNQQVVNYEDTWELYAKPVVARAEPPILPSIQNTVTATKPARFGSVDVRQTSLHQLKGETVTGAQFDATPIDQALAETKRVRIIEGFSSEGSPGNTMFGLTMAEGAAILGEADVYGDGSWLAEIPPYVPVHLQPIDQFDLAIRSQTLWIQGMPGEDRVCGGCHESRTSANLPGGQAQTIATGRGPQNFVRPVAQRIEYPWSEANDAANPNQIQALLDAKCVSCHNETTNGSGAQTFYSVQMENAVTGTSYDYQIPRLDLSSRPITVTYDRMTRAWPASYVSIFYPAAMEMEMNMGATVVGTLPPIWARPSDARGSALIEKLNVTSSLDAGITAWPLGVPFNDPNVAGASRTLHPDDVGIVLTREERVMLIRAIDMGGQYFARQNSDFVMNDKDPVH